ncbi:isopentenyl pyrophosphate isomerase [Brachybacterium phenoliresistens]|uniref:Isopentenyl-diphosphate delta-isomerase n=1 Tax=Brachybacterium phenoliresistens TaxID=396014 RepID=Z9JTF4_9MICO|nr:type 2 isopentenyl-diphosphate Delta-isomerase [Brachybacterium phenoliresistens]EWS81655.1 isopentenyl pyrophosphate isomerase [Brachybacterium phenoliresistens]
MGSESLAASRKEDHIRLAREQRSAPIARNDFDDVEFLHHALDGVDVAEVSLQAQVGPWTWSSPLYINGMTGGTGTAGRVNRALAVAARETGVPMASGSVGIALDDPSTAASFRVIREENPDGFVMANIGAGRRAEDARRAVDLLQADALQLHLNAVQETIMPEGDREFSSWMRGLEEVVAGAGVPVVVKEVGFGLSGRTQRRLAEAGVQVADVSGTGGTNFARIESARRTDDVSYLAGFGQSAPCCLLDAPADGPQLLASGGVRTPLDAVRAYALGARAAGVAGPFLTLALDGGEEGAVAGIGAWLTRIRELLALLGARSAADAAGTDVLVRGAVREFAQLRGIDLGALTHRTDARPLGSRPAGSDQEES